MKNINTKVLTGILAGMIVCIGALTYLANNKEQLMGGYSASDEIITDQKVTGEYEYAKITNSTVVSTTAGSPVITCATCTYTSDNIRVGGEIVIYNGGSDFISTVVSIDSDTQITIADNYPATATTHVIRMIESNTPLVISQDGIGIGSNTREAKLTVGGDIRGNYLISDGNIINSKVLSIGTVSRVGFFNCENRCYNLNPYGSTQGAVCLGARNTSSPASIYTCSSNSGADMCVCAFLKDPN